jgi:hypothetical protein
MRSVKHEVCMRSLRGPKRARAQSAAMPKACLSAVNCATKAYQAYHKLDKVHPLLERGPALLPDLLPQRVVFNCRAVACTSTSGLYSSHNVASHHAFRHPCACSSATECGMHSRKAADGTWRLSVHHVHTTTPPSPPTPVSPSFSLRMKASKVFKVATYGYSVKAPQESGRLALAIMSASSSHSSSVRCPYRQPS